MTWYESEIFIAPNEKSMEYLKNHPEFGDSTYLLPSEMEYEINGNEDVCKLGKKGLLVVRPFCDPQDHCAGWFEDGFIDWNSFNAKETIIAPIDICMSNEEVEPDYLPPIGFLAMLKKMSRDLDTNIVFFFSFMWGGDTELEYAWFFGEREEAFLMQEPGVQSVVDKVQFRVSKERIKLDILTESINYLGGNMTAPFFVYHTRGFKWHQFRL